MSSTTSTRDRIMHTAAEMFRERGYSGTTMKDVAQELGIASGLIFHHFGTKEELLVSVVERGIDHGVRQLEAASHHATGPRERLRLMVEGHLLSLLEGEPETGIDLFLEQWSFSASAIERMVAMRDRYERLWDDALAALGGAYGKSSKRHLTRLLLLGTLNWTAYWYRPGGEFDIATISAEIMELYFDDAAD